MAEFRKIIKKISLYFSIFLAGIVFSYVGYLLFQKYENSQDLENFLKAIWNYKLYSTGTSSVLTVGKIILVIILFFFSWFSAKYVSSHLIRKLLGKTQVNKGASAAIENLTYYILVVIFAIIALNIAEVPLTIFTLFGGALAIGLGFGSQNLVSNFISGIILQIEQPIKVGDVVEIEGVLGTVEHIGGRSTKILAANNTHTVVPNSYFLDKKFINWTLADNVVRSKIEILLAYKEDPKKVEDLVLKVIKINKDILDYPNPRVFLSSYKDSGVEYSIFFWISMENTTERAAIESNFRVELLLALQNEKIEIPYPQHVVRVVKE